MRGPRLTHLWGPLSHCYEGKMKIKLRKAENDGMATLKVGSIKNY